MPRPPDDISRALKDEAYTLGFDTVGITTPDLIGEAGSRLKAFLDSGRHGDMDWMVEKAARRADPRVLWPEVNSIVMVGMNYGADRDPLAALQERGKGVISIYAEGRDYHDVVKKRLKQLARWLVQYTDSGVALKVFVDTAPVMEKPLAAAAGLGWQGKHTNLVSRRHGSWLFLGALYTTLPLAADSAHEDACGSCQKCLDICPTNAFPAPYQLDARRCISYLTIEHQGHIDRQFRTAIGNRIFGCDDCLAVCPWNKFASLAQELRFHGTANTRLAPLETLLQLNDTAFRERFSRTPVKRLGWTRFLRNLLIAAGNSDNPKLIPHIQCHLTAASPLVRAMAVWALNRLLTPEAFATLRKTHASNEPDKDVQAEWQRGV